MLDGLLDAERKNEFCSPTCFRATSAAAYQTGQAGYAVTPAATAATYTQRPAAAAATGYETYQAAAAAAATGTTYAGDCLVVNTTVTLNKFLLNIIAYNFERDLIDIIQSSLWLKDFFTIYVVGFVFCSC